jgi:hypothetical protein
MTTNLLRLEPIEGNGWYIGDQRVLPPPVFDVDITVTTSNDQTKSFVGTVVDPSSEFDGLKISGVQTFFADDRRVSVRLDRRQPSLTESEDNLVSGHVRVVTWVS